MFRQQLAHALITFVVVASLGAAEGPNRSVAESTPNHAAQTTAAAQKTTKTKTKPYEVGTASWYGSDFDGKTTASGEPYNMYDLTAAHPALPLGSFVRVTNLRNGRAVTVKINDRGPVVPGRIIDLSYNAARALAFKDKGLQRVRLDVVHPKVAPPQLVAMNRE